MHDTSKREKDHNDSLLKGVPLKDCNVCSFQAKCQFSSVKISRRLRMKEENDNLFED